MPARDRTGPLGEGPMTGRGLGPCGRGLARGYGQGRGLGLGRGFAWRARDWSARPADRTVNISREEQKQVLEQELKDLEAEKQAIEKRLKDMGQ